MANGKNKKRYIVRSEKDKVHIVNAISEKHLYEFLNTQYPEETWESLKTKIKPEEQ